MQDERNRSLPRLSLLAIPLLAGLMVLWYRLQGGAGYPLDDSWIHLAFARHLAAGDGFGINPGQLSTGSTAPLWTLLLSVGYLLRAGHLIWPWLLGFVCLSGAGFAGVLVIQRLCDRKGLFDISFPSLAVGLLIVSTTGLVWSAAGAMEVPLFASLLMFAWAKQIGEQAGDRFPWGIPAGLAALTRPEGLLFVLILAISSRPKSAVRNLIISGLVYAPFAIFCKAVSGRWFPSTFYAKTSRAVAGLPDPGYLGQAIKLIWELAPALVILLVAGVFFKLMLNRGGWRRVAPGWLFLLSLPIAYAVMGRTFLFAGGAGNFGRYFFPLLPFLAVLGVWGLSARSGSKPLPLYTRLILIAALLVNTGFTIHKCEQYKHNVNDINLMQVEMAHRLAAAVPAGSLVAANDVGALAYFTDLRVLDLVGIVSPEVQEVLFPIRHMGRPERISALFDLIMREKPPVMVVFPRWYPEIVSSLEPISEPLTEIVKRDNITSAANRLRAISLHWERAEKTP